MNLYRWYTLAIIFSFLFLTMVSFALEKQPDGVLFELKKQKETDPQWLKIQVCTENIIRVIASPEKSFSSRPSLMVNKTNWEPVVWSTKEKGDWIELSTQKLMVRVHSKTGAIVFCDAAGNVLLQEKAGGGKIISSTEVMGEKTFHIQQVFDSPQSEAFYGLGAHQNGIMNYKGKDVDLWQYNIVDVVPFLVSSENYGILWDNYSRTKFGDIRDYQALSSFILYSKDGVQGGLTADYYKDANFQSLLTSKTEATIEHEFTDVPGQYPDGFDRNDGSIRWSGEIASNQSGEHKFKFYSSGYLKVWLDGKLLFDVWRQNWLPWSQFPRLQMEAGKRYPITIEWIPSGGYIGVRCLTPEESLYKNALSLYSEVADQIEYYFIHGANPDQVIAGERLVTGKAPMMPKWAMGFWQCRERYKTQDELLSTVKEFRQRQIPLDNIVEDWFYWKEDQWGSHEFDPERFPNPDTMVKQLHDSLNAHIMISVWPKFYLGTKHYDEMKKRGYLFMHSIEQKRRDWVGHGYVSTFFDPFSEGARDLYWKQINNKLFSKGFDAWWLDATEPDMGDVPSNPERLLRMHPNALGTAARYENAFSLMLTSGVYTKQRQTKPDQRVFILTRSTYAGQQRNAAASWSGDIVSRWHDLKAQIPAGLNMSLSGIPYWTTDIGGFALEPRYEHPNVSDLDEWRELNTRWYQFGAFCPIFRVHGQFPLREIFNMAPEDHPAYQSMLAYNKLRYRLMPYIYSLTGMVTHQDYTMMRGLVMDFGTDKNVLNINDQFMFGPAFLVNPVSEYKSRSRAVYLPSGSDWYEFKTGTYNAGGQTIQADAPYTEIPLYIKAGSIIPCGPEIQYTTEKPADPMRVFVYTGSNGSFTLYEDENTNYNYEKGEFTTIPLSYNEQNKELTIGKQQGSFAGMLKKRIFEIIFISKQKPSGLDFQSKPDAQTVYDGGEQMIKMK
jgi:alpha-D-xyloside xylohydrolase